MRGLDDFGNSLHGATPESIADEIISRGAKWDLVAAAHRLSVLRVLSVTAKFGAAADNRATTAALRRAGNAHVTAVEMATDHPFSDHRIALAATVIGWLKHLRP